MKLCWILLGLLFVALTVTGSMDYQEELNRQQLYCEMVSSGAWGDYNANYNELCTSEPAGEAATEKGQED